jgi:predicted Zn finger-like uncharacterized protein
MSFTTRCPACGTTFRIVADQLKISEGWVRCGHCADVFDATLYLEPWTPDTPAPAISATPPERSVPAEFTVASDPEDNELLTKPPAPWPEDPPAAEPAEADFSTELQKFAAAKAVADAQVAASSASSTKSVKPAEMPVAAENDDQRAPDNTDLDAVPGFVRQAQQRAFWQSTGVRIGLSVLALLLAALLGAQWALHERDRIAAWRPDLQPLLMQLCAPLGCSVGPVRNIEAIVIDSSALVRRLGNFHSFDLVLKNTSDIPLALPALELTLTDTRDAVISRRVFLPEDWPDAPEALPALGSVTVSFRLSLAVGEATPMAGYRALVFYP